MSLQIVKYGTKVTLANGSIKAFITGVCIRDQSISYEVSYFHSGNNLCCWVRRFEFEIEQNVKDTIYVIDFSNKPERNFMDSTH